MLEYEYSFEVEKVEPYINYCERKCFKKIEESSQVRILYKNTNKILARITTKEKNGIVKTVLDFKDDDNSEKVLKVSRESIPLEINDGNMESILSILDILGYNKDKELIRKRIIYKKENITFEIDDYTSPNIMHVVAIEGEKAQVDEVYNEIKNI